MKWALVTMYAAKIVLIMIERRLHYGVLGSRVRIVDHIHVVCSPVKQSWHSQEPVVPVV
jgi:hypothetical protein